MTTQPRPGVPVPPDEWLSKLQDRFGIFGASDMRAAAAWGADEQLRLCVEWIESLPTRDAFVDLPHFTARKLQSAMRPKPPKPPTLKEQALAAVDHLLKSGGSGSSYDTIRRALNALPNE
jgi:hypothetical protein